MSCDTFNIYFLSVRPNLFSAYRLYLANAILSLSLSLTCSLACRHAVVPGWRKRPAHGCLSRTSRIRGSSSSTSCSFRGGQRRFVRSRQYFVVMLQLEMGATVTTTRWCCCRRRRRTVGEVHRRAIGRRGGSAPQRGRRLVNGGRASTVVAGDAGRRVMGGDGGSIRAPAHVDHRSIDDLGPAIGTSQGTNALSWSLPLCRFVDRVQVVWNWLEHTSNVR